MANALKNSLIAIARILGSGLAPGPSKAAEFVPVSELLLRESRKRQPIDELSLIPMYPPFDHGLPFIQVHSTLQTQQEMLRRIKLQAGLHDSEYERLFEPVLLNYASYVHLLPATRDDYFRGAGGLLRMGLEVGFFSLQASSGVIFTGRESAGQRRLKEPRWRFLTFVAGLCYGIDRILSQMIITTEDGEQWPCYTSTLFEWMEMKEAERYFITWLDTAQSNTSSYHASSFVLNRILPEECVQYIAEAGNELVSVLMSVLTGATSRGIGDPVYEIVSKTMISVIERDRKADPASYGKVVLGTHLERYIIDAIRKLIKTHWNVNQKKARCWYSTEGVFLIWQSGSKDVWDALQKQRLPGIPESPETLAEVMLASGMIVANPEGSVYWTIFPPSSSSSDGYRAVKFRSKELIFDHVLLHGADESDGIGKQNPVAPIAQSLLVRAVKVPSSANNGALRRPSGRLVPVEPAPSTSERADPGVEVAASSNRAPSGTIGVSVQQMDRDDELVPHVHGNGAEGIRDLTDAPGADVVAAVSALSAAHAHDVVQLQPVRYQAEQSQTVLQHVVADFSDVLQDADESLSAPGVTPDTFGVRTDTARLFIQSIRDDFNSRTGQSGLFTYERGVAITSMEIGRRGVPKNVLDEWLDCGVLVPNERGSALHKLERGSERVSCALFRAEYIRLWRFVI